MIWKLEFNWEKSPINILITFGPRELPGLEGKRIYEHNLFSKKGTLEMR